MPLRERARWALAAVLSMAMLSAPAVWNRFPLLQYDTGGYLARWYEGYLVPSRAVVYGLILGSGSPLSFWPVVLGQSALTVWVIALVLRTHGMGGRPELLAGVIAALSVISTLPWLTAVLLTDIFAGLGAFALYLLLLRTGLLSRSERCGLSVLIALSAATHNATFAVLYAACRRQTSAPFLKARRLWGRRDGAWRRVGARGQCGRRQAAGVDAWRVCPLLRPHAAGWDRYEISRRTLSAGAAGALQLQG